MEALIADSAIADRKWKSTRPACGPDWILSIRFRPLLQLLGGYSAASKQVLANSTATAQRQLYDDMEADRNRPGRRRKAI